MGKLDVAQPPPHLVLWCMDTPRCTPVSKARVQCAGAQRTLFGIGAFNPSAVPLTPNVQVCSSPATVRDWRAAGGANMAGLVDGTITGDDADGLLRAWARGRLPHCMDLG